MLIFLLLLSCESHLHFQNDVFQLKMKYGNFTEKDPTKLLTPKQLQGKHFQSYVLNNGKSIKLKRLHVR